MSVNENAAAAYGAVWLDANRFYEAERNHYEMSLAQLALQARKRANPGSPPSKTSVPNGISQSSLASEIAYARQKIQNFLKSGDVGVEFSQPSILNRLEKYEKQQEIMINQIQSLTSDLRNVISKLASIEKTFLKPLNMQVPVKENTKSTIQNGASTVNEDDDDDIDLFGSDEEDAAAAKLKEERLQAYANKKAKKPALVAKSSVVLDVKPWDDETDMKTMEKAVREIKSEGLVWGASKLVPLAYGINKLQIVAVVEDEKVSIDWLQETISEIEDLVQSVDIAAFNKL